jgi:hypothetical protein
LTALPLLPDNPRADARARAREAAAARAFQGRGAPQARARYRTTDKSPRALGKALKPKKVLSTVCRVIRATYLRKEPGGLSSLENPAALKALAEAT